MAAWKQELGGDYILTHTAYVLPRESGCFDFHLVVTAIVDLFDHDDRIGVIGQHMAGIDEKSVLSDLELPGAGLAGSEGLLRLDRNAIHGRRMKIRRGQPGKHRCRQNTSHGLRHRYRFGGRR